MNGNEKGTKGTIHKTETFERYRKRSKTEIERNRKKERNEQLAKPKKEQRQTGIEYSMWNPQQEKNEQHSDKRK